MFRNSKSKYVFFIAVLLVIALAVGVSALLRGQPSVSAASHQQWEYLTVHYSQLTLDYEAENPIELVYSNDQLYDITLFGELICPDAFAFDQSCDDLFRGQAYYLNLWGNDGWELININDKSDQYTYSVEMIFKRLR